MAEKMHRLEKLADAGVITLAQAGAGLTFARDYADAGRTTSHARADRVRGGGGAQYSGAESRIKELRTYMNHDAWLVLINVAVNEMQMAEVAGETGMRQTDVRFLLCAALDQVARKHREWEAVTV